MQMFVVSRHEALRLIASISMENSVNQKHAGRPYTKELIVRLVNSRLERIEKQQIHHNQMHFVKMPVMFQNRSVDTREARDLCAS